jgi:hypothetical protein
MMATVLQSSAQAEAFRPYDECLALLAEAVSQHDEARLDEVAIADRRASGRNRAVKTIAVTGFTYAGDYSTLDPNNNGSAPAKGRNAASNPMPSEGCPPRPVCNGRAGVWHLPRAWSDATYAFYPSSARETALAKQPWR